MTGYSIWSAIWPLLLFSAFLTTSQSRAVSLEWRYQLALRSYLVETENRNGRYNSLFEEKKKVKQFYRDDGLPQDTVAHVPTRNCDNTFKNKYHLIWCLLKMRHAVFTTCCLCCTDGTPASMPAVYFNKARLSLAELTIPALVKSLPLFKYQCFSEILHVMNGCWLSSGTLHFKVVWAELWTTCHSYCTL